MEKDAVMFALLAVVYVFLLESMLGNIDIWGAYYYRHVQNTLDRGTTVYYDELSYLGRNFTFPPAFFEFAASVSKLLGVASFESIRIPLHLSIVALFFLSTYLLFNNFKTREQKLLASLIFASQSFVMITSTGITLHIFSYLLLNVSVLLFSRKEALMKLLSALALSIAFAAHPTSLLFFPVYVYAAGLFKMDRWKLLQAGANCALAVLLSLPFYIPIFIRSGLPYEIVPAQWGYMLSYGVGGVMFDFQFSTAMLVASILYGLQKREFRLPTLILLGFLLADIFVTFRANMLVTIMLSALFPQLFSKYMRNGTLLALFFAIPLVDLMLVPVVYSGTTDWCTWGVSNRMCIPPMQYINQYTPTETKVAINPEYGHLEAYYGGRPVLADLYVEYADYDKFSAENEFYWKSNTSGLGKYNISLFVLDDIGTKKDIPDADRIYDNGFIHIFR